MRKRVVSSLDDLRGEIVAARSRERDLKQRIATLKWDNRALRAKIMNFEAYMRMIKAAEDQPHVD